MKASPLKESKSDAILTSFRDGHLEQLLWLQNVLKYPKLFELQATRFNNLLAIAARGNISLALLSVKRYYYNIIIAEIGIILK